MRKERLFFWPACIYSYKKDEGHDQVNWPFPAYENGDIFLAWGEVELVPMSNTIRPSPFAA